MDVRLVQKGDTWLVTTDDQPGLSVRDHGTAGDVADLVMRSTAGRHRLVLEYEDGKTEVCVRPRFRSRRRRRCARHGNPAGYRAVPAGEACAHLSVPAEGRHVDVRLVESCGMWLVMTDDQPGLLVRDHGTAGDVADLVMRSTPGRHRLVLEYDDGQREVFEDESGPAENGEPALGAPAGDPAPP